MINPVHPEAGAASFSDNEFERLAAFANRSFGLKLSPAKKPLVYSRISKRLIALKIDSLNNYIDLVEKGNQGDERLELISALTTNVTAFFRENHHFDTVRKEIIPTIAARAGNQKRVRFWSAGCSSGEEPYSLAMTLLEYLQSASSLDLKILATDIDPKVVQRARQGEYRKENLDQLPAGYLAKYFRKVGSDDSYSVSPEIRRIVTFGELNLIETLPIKGPFDAIFCRNVAIYFDMETQQKVWNNFADLLLPGGHLFIGHSERLTGPALNTLKITGVTTYRKNGLPLSGWSNT
ncbi:CheR family methyltransferase [Citreimonas salinaria]|uniref:Chemotaxis protein methyltransferase n=1 Tax=Citreimonas salinaria TaxID=321339 RepID=A0A1H3JGX7_9RHOB|nr:protein-glutamate O-methyltransferase CheR [Citreimonas salinaria]SDY38839.1 chemotaxis protein methyltransferase CheR [Citreimonas salinaria]